MKFINSNLRSSSLISFILVVPFMILELINNRNSLTDFPFVLFGLLWLLPMAFIIILLQLVRDVRAHTFMANPIKLLLSGTALLIIAVLWGGIVVDQLPCFIGVPNCD